MRVLSRVYRALRSRMRRLLKRPRQLVKSVRSSILLRIRPFLVALSSPRFRADDQSDVVISITSFPARIDWIWATIDTLFRQDARLQAILLVLSEEEFPQRRLPKSLRRRIRRGLTVEWVQTNQKSYDKLLPARVRYPSARILTVDDDKLYPIDMASKLIRASDEAPGAVIGHFGRQIVATPDGYDVLSKADPATPSERVFLIGLGGILYPPTALHPDVQDYRLAMELCPSHDDAWFWAMSVRARAPRVCLGSPKPAPLLAQRRTPALASVNAQAGSEQINAVIDRFDLVQLLARRPMDSRNSSQRTHDSD